MPKSSHSRTRKLMSWKPKEERVSNRKWALMLDVKRNKTCALTLVVRPLTYLAKRYERNSEDGGLQIIEAPNKLPI